MGFVVMDTADSACVLFDGMTLPASDGEIKEHSGMIPELYSIENETLYVAKVRITDTVIYVSARAEYKPEAVGLLEKLGYWKSSWLK